MAIIRNIIWGGPNRTKLFPGSGDIFVNVLKSELAFTEMHTFLGFGWAVVDRSFFRSAINGRMVVDELPVMERRWGWIFPGCVFGFIWFVPAAHK